MASTPWRNVRIFLSSPGDVSDERALALQVFDTLASDPLLHGKVIIDAVAWDKPGSDTPMLATMTPQEAINQGLMKPSDCDIVIVIFWSRMGTPLPPEYAKSDGSRYESGTEWEFIDAVTAAHQSKQLPARPQVLVYRRTEKVFLDVDAPDFESKIQQRRRVTTFFDSFVNPDGSIQAGVNHYQNPSDFRLLLERHLKRLIATLLENSAPINPVQVSPVEEPVYWEGSPFLALRAFTPDDAPIFFGRDAATDSLLERIKTSQLVALVGASGSGKSSLVGAGLIPRLMHNALEGSKDWLIPHQRDENGNRIWVGLRFTPGEVGDNPFMALAIHLAPMLGSNTRDLCQELEKNPSSITSLTKPLFNNRPIWSRALIFVDQFEELFTLADAKYIDGFVAMLQAIAQSERLYAILTMRSDFYPRSIEHPTLTALLNDSTFPLAAPDVTELIEMVERPAMRAGLRFPDGMIKRILKDTGTEPGALALMIFALNELYNARTTGQELTATYESIGGVHGAIGKRAEALYAALSEAAQKALFSVFRELIDVDERGEPTRRRVMVSRVASSEATTQLVNSLTDARLLVQTQGANGMPVVEVAHEALLRNWPRLAQYISNEMNNLRLRRQIEQAARQWENIDGAHKADYLLIGSRLEEAQQWLKHFPAEEQSQAFIQASHQAETARRKHDQAIVRRIQTYGKMLAGLAAVGVIAVVAMIAATLQAVNANNQIVTATVAQGRAQQIQDTAVVNANNAKTEVANANSTLTPVAEQVRQSQIYSDSLNLAAQASTVLQSPSGDPALAELLSIRALRARYVPQGDAALVKAIDSNNQKTGLIGHRDSVLSVAISPDGRFVLTGSQDMTARLWDIQTGKLIHIFNGYIGAVTSVAFSPSGRFILTGSMDGKIRIWNTLTGESALSLTTQDMPVTSVAYSPDNRYIVAGLASGQAIVWDLFADKLSHDLIGHKSEITGAAFSSDGRDVVTGSADGTARLWDVATGQTVLALDDQGQQILSVAISRDSHFILTGSSDFTAILWDAATGSRMRTFVGHKDAILSVAFSPDGHYILTGSQDFLAILWDIATGLPLRTFSGHTGSVTGVAFSPDGSSVLTGSEDKTAILWNITRKTPLDILAGHKRAVYSAIFSPDGRYILTGSDDATAILWDATTGAQLRVFTGHKGYIASAVFSPDGRSILTGSDDATAILWDVATGTQQRMFTGHAQTVYSVAISPDGNYALTGSWDRTAILWDIKTGRNLHTFAPFTDSINSVAFSPNGHYIVLGSYDMTATLWDATTYSLVHRFSGHNGAVLTVAFSPDSRYIVTGSKDKTAILWDVATGNRIRTFSGHKGYIWGTAFSPDGRYILTSSQDQTAILWNVATGAMVRTLSGHTDFVYGAAFSPNGRYMLTASEDRTARLWDVDYHDLIASACAQLWRDFSSDERAQYGVPPNESTCPKFAAKNSQEATPLATATSLPVTMPVWTLIAPPTAAPNTPTITPTITATYPGVLLTFTPESISQK